MSKALIAYYSRKGQNYVGGEVKNLERGNTEIIAEFIHFFAGGELFEIETVKTYPADYKECTTVAKEEMKNKFRPELKSYPDSIDEYEKIFIGYPCWWGTMPMAVYAFLEHYDFADKKIIPFTTHEGSGFGRSLKEIKKICPRAKILEGLAIQGSAAPHSKSEVVHWLRSVAH